MAVQIQDQTMTIEMLSHEIKRWFRYRVFHIAKNWTEADLACKNIGGHLVSLQDETEWNEVLGFIETECSSERGFWTSGTRLHNGTFTWKYRNPEINSALWFPGQPGGDGDCLHLHENMDYKLNDFYCSTKMCYICDLSQI